MSHMRKSPVSPGDIVKIQNVVVVDSEDAGVTQHGTWTQVASRDASHLTYIYSDTPGDYLEYKFKGTGIWLRVYLSADAGKAKISIDGGTPVTIDLYASTTRLHTPFVHSNLAPGEEHTIKIEVSDEKNASSSGYKIGVDAFLIELSRGAMQIWAMIETAIETVTELTKFADIIPDVDLSRSLGDATHRWLNLYLQYLKLYNRTSDPSSPDIGDIWYRSDLEKISLKRSVVDRIVLEELAQTLTNKTLSSGSTVLGADDLPGTIASILTDHTKAVHDALGIDADTVDGKHADELGALGLYTYGGVFWFNNEWHADILDTALNGSGSISRESKQLILKTGATSGSYAVVKKRVASPVPTSWAKKRRIKIRFYMDAFTNQNAHLVSGLQPNSGSANTYQHIGFKIVNGTLYGTVANGITESTLTIETLSGASERTLEAVFTPGVECRFYVDGVDKGALTTNLPTSAYHDNLLQLAIHNSAAGDKWLYIMEVRVLQEA